MSTKENDIYLEQCRETYFDALKEGARKRAGGVLKALREAGFQEEAKTLARQGYDYETGKTEIPSKFSYHFGERVIVGGRILTITELDPDRIRPYKVSGSMASFWISEKQIEGRLHTYEHPEDDE